jgi:hypothetical protein
MIVLSIQISLVGRAFGARTIVSWRSPRALPWIGIGRAFGAMDRIYLAPLTEGEAQAWPVQSTPNLLCVGSVPSIGPTGAVGGPSAPTQLQPRALLV